MVKAFINKEWFKRSYRTFFQAFIASLAIGILTILETIEVSDPIKALLVASLAAGISAVMNKKKQNR